MKTICLDLTRLVSRVGRGPWTGIDRVEAAWLDRVLRPDIEAFAIIRLQRRYALLDKRGMAALADRLHGRTPWGRSKLGLRLSSGLNPLRRRAESDVRRLAAAVSARATLTGLVACLPENTIYLNTGHTNLSPRVLSALERNDCLIAVLIHDVIPLTHPEFQRPGTPAKFKTMLRAVAKHAALVIFNSAATKSRVESRFAAWGGISDSVVAHLGLGAMPLRSDAIMRPDGPYFVTLGTIEPRKNHKLLLDVWARLGPKAPKLLIVGQRGWANQEVFDRLDNDPMMGSTVFEYNDLEDPIVTDLLRGAQALLFPSRAEGFGLPAWEAARLGTPVACPPLPVFKEILGDYPVYVTGEDPMAWLQAVETLAGQTLTTDERLARALTPPTWEAHFNQVLGAL